MSLVFLLPPSHRTSYGGKQGALWAAKQLPRHNAASKGRAIWSGDVYFVSYSEGPLLAHAVRVSIIPQAQRGVGRVRFSCVALSPKSYSFSMTL